ncbi:hypothetical protein Tco_1275419 [Tanacetum coccineum]
MAEPNDYITATRKNFVTNDNEGRMVEKCIYEIQGEFLVKIRDYAFNGNIRENVFKHIDKFLEVIGPIKINGLTQDRFKLSVFPVSLVGAASEWFTKECIGSITTWDNMVERFIMKFHHLSDHDEEEETKEDDNPNETDNVPEIFKIEGIMFDFETPLCEAFYEFNYLLKIDTDLFTYDIQNFKWYDEYERELNNDKAKGIEEPWSKSGVPYQLCDHICEPYHLRVEKLSGPHALLILMGSIMVEITKDGSSATLEVMKFYGWLKNSFENFHELDYDILASNPYLDVNRIFGRDYEASNIGDTLENQGHEEHKGNPNLETLNCKFRRFEMMKYSFDDDEDYITIKESEYHNHSKDSLDAYRELLCLIDEGWVVTTPDE